MNAEQTPPTGISSLLGKALVENFRARVEDAIIAEINDPRNVDCSNERSGLRVARIILNREAKRFTNG